MALWGALLKTHITYPVPMYVSTADTVVSPSVFESWTVLNYKSATEQHHTLSVQYKVCGMKNVFLFSGPRLPAKLFARYATLLLVRRCVTKPSGARRGGDRDLRVGLIGSQIRRE